MYKVVTPANAGVQEDNLRQCWIPGSAPQGRLSHRPFHLRGTFPSVTFAGMMAVSYFIVPEQ